MQNKQEVVFDLDAAAFSSDDFRMYQFKVRVGDAAGSGMPRGLDHKFRLDHRR